MLHDKSQESPVAAKSPPKNIAAAQPVAKILPPLKASRIINGLSKRGGFSQKGMRAGNRKKDGASLTGTEILDNEKLLMEWIQTIYRGYVEMATNFSKGKGLVRGDEAAEVEKLLPSPPANGLSDDNQFNVSLKTHVVAARKLMV